MEWKSTLNIMEFTLKRVIQTTILTSDKLGVDPGGGGGHLGSVMDGDRDVPLDRV